MRLLFLDIDGVLNSSRFFAEVKPNPPFGLQAIDPQAVERLNRIFDATLANVVVSSSWRLYMDPLILTWTLQQAGVKGRIVGFTPSEHTSRGKEIDAWLTEYAQSPTEGAIDAFVILDDDGDIEPHLNRFVRTDWNEGLTDEHVARAIALLT